MSRVHQRLAAKCIIVLLLALGVVCAQAEIEGLYYDQNGVQRAYFTGNVVALLDPNVDFNFGGGSPAPGIGVNDFSIIWSGILTPSTTEPYTFQTRTDDGVRLYLDGVLIIDNFTDHAPTTDTSAPVNLVAGQPYAIRMEFYERGGGAEARLRWRTPTIATEAIPPANLSRPDLTVLSAAQACGTDEILLTFSRLLDPVSAQTVTNYAVSGGATVTSAVLEGSATQVRLTVTNLDPSGHTTTINNVSTPSGDVIAANTQVLSAIPTNGLNGTYFNQNGVQRAYFTGGTFNRIDPVVGFNFGSGAPAPGIGANDFSVRWIGEVEAPRNGAFRFVTRSDDGVRLFIDGTLVINNFTDHGPTTNQSAVIVLTAGQRYQVIMEFYERGGGAVAELRWVGPGIAQQLIPEANLFPLCSLPPLPQPVAEYEFEQTAWTGAAGEVSDSTGNGHNGTAVNGADTEFVTSAIPGDPGTCRYGHFSQDNAEFVQIPYDAALNPDGDFTVAGWVRVTGKRNTYRSVFTSRWANNPSATRRRGYNIYAGSNNRWQFWTGVGGAQWDIVTGPAVQQDVWTHIAVTFQTQTQSGLVHRGVKRIYIDGVRVATSSNRRYSPNTISDAFIGAGENTGGFYHFEGDIDELHVFDGRLQDAEIATLMNQTRPCQPLVDHYAVTHALTGLTCEAEAVTISAHDNASPTHGTVEANSTITITTAPATSEILLKSGTAANFTGGTGSAQYTFAPGETDVELWLRQTTPIVVNIGVIDDNGATALAAENAPLDFRETALRFFAGNVANGIGTQISGKPSNIGPGAQSLNLRVIETNAETGACQARLIPNPVNVDMAFECIDPATCLLPAGVQINGNPISANPAGSITNYAPVPFAFDPTGRADFVLNYADAGLIALHARLILPDDPPQPLIELVGDSFPFVVKPAGLCVAAPQADSGCAAADASCSRFRRAGDPFTLTVTAMAWESAGEADDEFCTGNTPTGNFRLSNIALGPHIVAPGGGTDGALARTTADITTSGAVTLLDQVQNEVGIFTIEADPPDGAYHGETIAAARSTNIGRFYPAYFGLVPNMPAVTDACGTFTYQDQPFYYATAPDIELTAINVDGDPTLNYTDSFFMLNTTLERDFTDQAGQAAILNVIEDADVRITGNDVFDGKASLALDQDGDGDEFVYQRTASEAPFNADFDIEFTAAAFTDSDDVCYDPEQDSTCNSLTMAAVGATELRFGRLNMTSAFGSELLPLAIPVTAEYFNGTSFVTNAQDNCSQLVLASQVALSNPASGSGLPGTTTMTVGSGTSSIVSATPILAGGAATLEFSAPGAGNSGFIDITTDLITGSISGDTAIELPWLLFNWDGGAAFDQDPTARASFGLFPGRREIIYIREPWD